jgi:hypothetical protein
LHEKLHNSYSSPDGIRIIRSKIIRWVGAVAQVGENRNAYKILVGIYVEMRPLGRPRNRSSIINDLKRNRTDSLSSE